MLTGPGETVRRARRLRRTMTLPEVLLWRELRGRPGGLKFRRQHPAGRYVLDFFCAPANAAIEIDGAAHDALERAAHDRIRDAWLAREGIRLIRLPASAVLRDPAAAAAALAAMLAPDQPLHQPPAGPPPRTGEEPIFERPSMTRDRLYILPATFADPALPGRSFYCRDCVTVDGLLALFPDRAAAIDVIRVDYPRPRGAVIDAIGVANQNLPVLVLAADADPVLADGEHDGTRFVGDIKRLLHALHVRHGFPEAHP